MALTRYVENPRFEAYRERFREHFAMERRGGIVLLRMHTLGKEVRWSWELHRAIGQAFRTVGSDPENEVMILTSGARPRSGPRRRVPEGRSRVPHRARVRPSPRACRQRCARASRRGRPPPRSIRPSGRAAGACAAPRRRTPRRRPRRGRWAETARAPRRAPAPRPRPGARASRSPDRRMPRGCAGRASRAPPSPSRSRTASPRVCRAARAPLGAPACPAGTREPRARVPGALR